MCTNHMTDIEQYRTMSRKVLNFIRKLQSYNIIYDNLCDQSLCRKKTNIDFSINNSKNAIKKFFEQKILQYYAPPMRSVKFVFTINV